ncbi:unnamed protein product [Phytophthora fragariaefolia]|uniref:Unnamed protein product n=1 Tax=Phytophthora fragariaefolia TaxID=1490495 RepID=A0A9W6UA86_9STRA|nr:unnamed protein product [Phytophthora fragariaefolia]
MYDPSNAFNMDEAGLCYNRAPVGDIWSRKKPDVKASKTRITVAFRANADGTELLPLLYISRARKPLCFKRKMRAEGRNILQLLDNAAPHVSGRLALTDVSVKM